MGPCYFRSGGWLKKRSDLHDWSEADTRRFKIDALLAEAGWGGLIVGRDIEYEVRGMPSDSGVGYVDYVLWGDDGLPLRWWRRRRLCKTPGRVSSRPSCMPTVWKLRPGGGLWCSTATVMSIGFGTTPGARRGRCRLLHR